MKTAIAIALLLAASAAQADTLTPLQFPTPPASLGPITSVRCQPQKFVDANFVGECVFIGPRAIGRYVQSKYFKFAAQWSADGSVILGAQECYQPQYLGVPTICPQPDYVSGPAVVINGSWWHIDAVNSLGQELVNNVFAGGFWTP